MPKYIDVDKAIFAVRKKLVDLDTGSTSYAYYSACKDALRDMPAEEVREDTHGQWIEDDYAFNHCSECGYELVEQPWSRIWRISSPC